MRREEKEKIALEMAITMYMSADEYYDAGNQWCKKCNVLLADLGDLCQHLHSDSHQRGELPCPWLLPPYFSLDLFKLHLDMV